MRLTQNLRKEIIRNAMAIRFDVVAEAMYAEEAELGLRAYNTMVTPEMQAAIKVLEDSKMSWLYHKATVISFYVDGIRINMAIKGPALALPQQGYMGTFVLKTRDVGKTGAMAKELTHYNSKREDLNTEREKAEKQLTVLLKSVHSTETLAKVWPEGAKLYSSPPLPKVMAGLPAVQIAELNKMIGLDKAA